MDGSCRCGAFPRVDDMPSGARVCMDFRSCRKGLEVVQLLAGCRGYLPALVGIGSREGGSILSLGSFHVKQYVCDLVNQDTVAGTERVSRETVRPIESSAFYASYSGLPLMVRGESPGTVSLRRPWAL